MFDGLRLHDRPQVLVAGDRIADVDLTGAQPPPGYQLVDLGDATLLPGLIDTHMHLVFDASTDPAGHLQAVSDETLLEEARAAARRALDAGVTCVRDLGDRSFLGVRLREETAANPGAGPDVVPAGSPITVPAGHCWFLGGATRGAGAVRNAVRDHADRGAAVIKVMVTGGHMTSGPDPGALAACQFSADELRAAADEAHQQGSPRTPTGGRASSPPSRQGSTAWSTRRS
jgi:imidazolonepropionase-like amidohydrolase